MVRVLRVLEKGQLLGFYRVLRHGTTHNDKTMGLVPSMRSFGELRNFPTAAHLDKLGCARLDFDGTVLLGHNHTAAACAVEELNNSLAIKPGVEPKSDARSANGLRNLRQAQLEERHGSYRGAGVSGPQAATPEFLEASFEAK